MIIAVDIDDTLADFKTHFVQFMNSKNSEKNQKYSVESWTTYDLCKSYNMTYEEILGLITGFYQADAFDDIKPNKGAVDAITKIAKSHKLVAITARPDFIASRTQQWIDKHFPGMFSQIYFTEQWKYSDRNDKKAKLCKEIGATVIIEDAHHYSTHCLAEGVKVILFHQPWNANLDKSGMIPVKSWDEIPQHIKKLDPN